MATPSEVEDAMSRRVLLAFLSGSALSLSVATATLAAESGNGSCTAQFTSVLAPAVIPFGTIIVVPEVQNLTLGGTTLGQEVATLFGTADRSACPVTP
jgi:hypothetical protein